MLKFKSLLSVSQRITFESLPSKFQAYITKVLYESSIKHFEVASMNYNVDGLTYKELTVYVETDRRLFGATYNERWNEARTVH